MIQSFTTNIGEHDVEVFYDDESNEIIRAEFAFRSSVNSYYILESALDDYLEDKKNKLRDNARDENIALREDEMNDDGEEINFDELT